MGQSRTVVEDHQDLWDELVLMLTLAYIRRQQQSTGMAPLELVRAFPPMSGQRSETVK